ncbi:MAG: hypothetical protein WA667_13965 [Candidatus Nitrosopolaris sp.]
MKTIVCSCGIKLKESERSQHGALFNNHEFFDISLMPEWTKKGRALAITLITLCLLVNVSATHVFAAHTGHSQAYIEGFKGAMDNSTSTTACGLNGSGNQYSSCLTGFDDGQTALEKTTLEYNLGYSQARNDSAIMVFDSSDTCKQYEGYKHQSCLDGYSAGYSDNSNILQPNASILVEKYKDSAPYQSGFLAGAKSGNETATCGVFKNRELSECQSAFNYGSDPGGHEPPHCSAIDTAANSCYNIGRESGFANAYKEIINCHMILIPPPSGHRTPAFDKGFKNGWKFANYDADKWNHTYGINNCTKYY